jgi:hypothetical protein
VRQQEACGSLGVAHHSSFMFESVAKVHEQSNSAASIFEIVEQLCLVAAVQFLCGLDFDHDRAGDYNVRFERTDQGTVEVHVDLAFLNRLEPHFPQDDGDRSPIDLLRKTVTEFAESDVRRLR